jgi:hypothetical protein
VPVWHLRPHRTFQSNNPPKVTFNGFYAEGHVQAPGTEAEAVLAQAHETSTGKVILKTFMTPGYLDARVYALYDKIPSLCYGPIAENIHARPRCRDVNASFASCRSVVTPADLLAGDEVPSDRCLRDALSGL